MSNVPDPGPILEASVHDVCPTAFVVPHRVLRRVVRVEAEERGVSQGQYRLDSFTVNGRVSAAADLAADLGLEQRGDVPNPVILVRGGVLRWFRRPTPAAERERLERALFRESLVVALSRASDREAFERLERIGRLAFSEAVATMNHDGRLRREEDPWSCYVDFAVTYLELHRYERRVLPYYFPSLDDPDDVERMLREDVDADAIATQTRLPMLLEVGLSEPEPTSRATLNEKPYTRWAKQRRAKRARRLSDSGHAAKAVVVAPRQEQDDVLGPFARRLASEVDAEADWADLLATIANRPTGFWSPPARLLYDLQRACDDAGRTAYAVRLVDWIGSWGARPLRRPIPLWSQTRVLRHLKRAVNRVAQCGLDRLDCERLQHTLDEVIHRRGAELRRICRPEVEAALDAAGLTPSTVVESVARRRIVEEYLDVVVERGFASLPNLRDTIARNDLKLADAPGPGEALRRDPLLRIDAELSERLAGVHRRGEVYLRWLQTLGAFGFGTWFGRSVLTHAVLPFVGSLVVLEGLQHLTIEPLAHFNEELHHVHLANPYAIAGLGAFLWVLVHRPEFRRRLGRWLGRMFRTAWRLPRTLSQLFRGIPLSVRRLGGWLLRPLVVLLIGGGTLQAMELPVVLPWTSLAVVYLSCLLLVNSRPVRLMEEVLLQELLRSWQSLLTGVFEIGRWIMQFFQSIVDGIERLLYAVDEALRSREGESRLVGWLRLVVGPIWAGIAYVVRFVVNLLVEPQINPIKHFPVVTVSHKLLLPMIPSLAGLFQTVGYDQASAYTTATAIITAVPGVFGFLVWELTGNWRLYESNRPRTLVPAVIGSHGETMPRMLRRGIHSGTLPRAYWSLCNAIRRDDPRGERRARVRIHHALECIEHLVEREFVALLEAGDDERLRWDHVHVEVAATIVRVTLEGDVPIRIVLAERSGWLTARIEVGDESTRFTDEQRRALRAALLGLYVRSDVDLVDEQTDRMLPADQFDVEPYPDGVVVRRLPDYDRPAWHDLVHASVGLPRALRWSPRTPPLGGELLLSERRIGWEDWVEEWEGGRPSGEILLTDYTVLPPELAPGDESGRESNAG